MKAIQIRSSQGPYKVEFIVNLDSVLKALEGVSSVVVLVDRKVEMTYRGILRPLSRRYPTLKIRATEKEKTLEGCARVLRFLQSNSATRGTWVVAIGGGIVQDIATFATHVYYRGIRWIYLPTTLLGMSDSCIGAKASINFSGFKNQLGVFHSPSKIFIYPKFLGSLPDDELRSGYGEVVKLSIAKSWDSFAKVRSILVNDGWRTGRAVELLRMSLLIKKSVIEVDEFDTGIRKTLNYGHTFGHALESVAEGRIPHGIAVAWGMDVVNYFAFRWDVITESRFREVHEFLNAKFSWRLSAPIDVEKLLEATRRDKKSTNGSLTLILPRQNGGLFISECRYSGEVKKWLEFYLRTLSIVTSA